MTGARPATRGLFYFFILYTYLRVDVKAEGSTYGELRKLLYRDSSNAWDCFARACIILCVYNKWSTRERQTFMLPVIQVPASCVRAGIFTGDGLRNDN